MTKRSTFSHALPTTRRRPCAACVDKTAVTIGRDVTTLNAGSPQSSLLVAIISARFERPMAYCRTLEAGSAEIRARVVARGSRCAQRLHASNAFTDFGCQSDAEGPAATGPSALCAGEHSRT